MKNSLDKLLALVIGGGILSFYGFWLKLPRPPLDEEEDAYGAAWDAGVRKVAPCLFNLGVVLLLIGLIGLFIAWVA